MKAVCGHVINPAGEKLNGVEFDLSDEKGSVVYTIKSDNRGVFRFDSVRKGFYTLHATAHGYSETEREISVIRDDGRNCSPKIEVTLGTSVCSTGTYVKGIDKPSDLDADFRNSRQ